MNCSDKKVIHSAKKITPAPYAIISFGGMVDYMVTYNPSIGFQVFSDTGPDYSPWVRMYDWDNDYEEVLEAGKNCLMFNKEI
jgi:hypothetical protein